MGFLSNLLKPRELTAAEQVRVLEIAKARLRDQAAVPSAAGHNIELQLRQAIGEGVLAVMGKRYGGLGNEAEQAITRKVAQVLQLDKKDVEHSAVLAVESWARGRTLKELLEAIDDTIRYVR